MESVGVGGLEPPTSRLSGERSNQLSYTPMDPMFNIVSSQGAASLVALRARSLKTEVQESRFARG